MVGEIDEVVAVTGRPLADMEGESLARALLRFESGTVAVFDALRAGAFMGPGEEFRVTGTEGELLVEKGREGRVMLYTKEHPDGRFLLEKDAGRSASFGYELQDFALAVLEGKTLQSRARILAGRAAHGAGYIPFGRDRAVGKSVGLKRKTSGWFNSLTLRRSSAACSGR